MDERKPPAGAPAARVDDYRELAHGLFDLQFQSIITTRMVPTIYALGLILAAVLTLAFVIRGFHESLLYGLMWLLLFGPALFVAVAVTLRISLEFILTLFRLAVAVEDLEESVQGIAGRTHEIAHDLPRIQFWKPRRRSTSDQSENPKT